MKVDGEPAEVERFGDFRHGDEVMYVGVGQPEDGVAYGSVGRILTMDLTPPPVIFVQWRGAITAGASPEDLARLRDP